MGHNELICQDVHGIWFLPVETAILGNQFLHHLHISAVQSLSHTKSSDQSGVTLCFQFVSAAMSTSAALYWKYLSRNFYLIGVKQKESKSVRQYGVGLWPHPRPWPCSFKVKVWNSLIWGMGEADWHGEKGMWVHHSWLNNQYWLFGIALTYG